MVTSVKEQAPVHCSTAADRAAREAATRRLMQRRAASRDETERQQLLEEVVELNIEMARGIAPGFAAAGPRRTTSSRSRTSAW
jgi:RNA polymerase sigma-B factor